MPTEDTTVPATEERIAGLIQEALAKWDLIHADGWNQEVLSIFPTAWHLAAKSIIDAYHLRS